MTGAACVYTNDYNAQGNVLETTFGATETAVLKIKDSNSKKLDYVLTVPDVDNPFFVETREKEINSNFAFDVEYEDNTPTNAKDAILYKTYDGYTGKFELGVYGTDNTAYKAFGVLSSAWLGFSATAR